MQALYAYLNVAQWMPSLAPEYKYQALQVLLIPLFACSRSESHSPDLPPVIAGQPRRQD